MHKGIRNKAQVTRMSMPCFEGRCAIGGLHPPLDFSRFYLQSASSGSGFEPLSSAARPKPFQPRL
jgi:hypothetical protein